MSLDPAFLVVNKPPDLTSHDVVAIVRAVTGVRKVGHTGTLDPFAQGVLPLALGAATRLIQFLDESRKIYDATISLGARTDTGDPTGRIVEETGVPALDAGEIRRVLAGFLGPCKQVPPRYSAVKLNGRRLYEYARKGQEVDVEARSIELFGLDLLEMQEKGLRVLITCSRGTYARVLAEDIARALGTVGHLRALTRRRSGPFTLESAISLDRLSEIVSGRSDWTQGLRSRRGEDRIPWRPRDDVHRDLAGWRIPPAVALSHLPSQPLPADLADSIRHGGPPPAPPIGLGPGQAWLLSQGDAVLAIARSDEAGGRRFLWRADEEG